MMTAAATPDLETIAKALGGKRMRDGFSCRCPAHEDKHNSLGLTVKDGKLLWRCHAGCSQAAVQDALVRAGLIEGRPVNGARQDGPRASGRVLHAVDGGKASRSSDSLGRIVATYDYVDVTGTLLFQVVRFEPKTFRQRRPKGSGWEWGLGRVEPVLYRLPEILAAERVFVVEGEKDVERLRKLGLVATTSPMGAGKWRPGFSEALVGKHVVILPDNDDAGREHADTVATGAIVAGARSVRIVALPKLPEKGDVSDWLDAGGQLDQLEAIVRAAPLVSDAVSAGDVAWRARLIQGDHGPVGNEANVALALRSAPELAGRLRYDAFRTALQCRDMPWNPRPEWRDWTDNDDVGLAVWVQERGVNFPSHRIPGVAGAVASDHEHHPVRDYLSGLKWDGTPRIDRWLSYYLGAEVPDDPAKAALLRAFGAKWMIGAVARVMRPGCKVDTALIFEGEQGKGKSSAIAILCGQEWFTDQIADLGNKDSSQDLRGKWVVEFAELKNVRGSEVEKVKAFLSRSVDHYRPSFGRRSIDVPRQCVFVGSTNADAYLHDATGNRRFWPVTVGEIDRKALAHDRDQLWAEAVHRFRKGEEWWLPKELERIASDVQAERMEEDTWSAFIVPFLAGKVETTTREVLVECLGKDKKDITRSDETRVGAVLRTLGFRSGEKRHATYGCRVYRKVGA